MILPTHQRRGIGGQLLRAVTDQGDKEGIPTLIVSSAESHGLYLKLGFEDLGQWTIDNGAWAKKIQEKERSLGMEVTNDLADKYEGAEEVECVMIRRPLKSTSQ